MKRKPRKARTPKTTQPEQRFTDLVSADLVGVRLRTFFLFAGGSLALFLGCFHILPPILGALITTALLDAGLFSLLFDNHASGKTLLRPGPRVYRDTQPDKFRRTLQFQFLFAIFFPFIGFWIILWFFRQV